MRINMKTLYIEHPNIQITIDTFTAVTVCLVETEEEGGGKGEEGERGRRGKGERGKE